jgi:hypothetical protein
MTCSIATSAHASCANHAAPASSRTRSFTAMAIATRCKLGVPNHVHALITTKAETALGQIVHSWKTFTTRRINSGPPTNSTASSVTNGTTTPTNTTSNKTPSPPACVIHGGLALLLRRLEPFVKVRTAQLPLRPRGKAALNTIVRRSSAPMANQNRPSARERSWSCALPTHQGPRP